MSPMFSLAQVLDSEWVIFTDLDGTLLDHHDYGFEPARPLLARLRADGIAVIPTTSKTPAELDALMRELGLAGAAIVENGAQIILPPGWLREGDETPDFGVPYAHILETLEELREDYDFTGFHDLGPQGVARHTGLSLKQAELAVRRTASEPLLWEDHDVALRCFKSDLARAGLKLLPGGRFKHVLGERADKSHAVDWLVGWLLARGWHGRTLGLGDAPNDHGMLCHVDVPVVVRNPDSPPMPPLSNQHIYRTRQTGPAGWAEAVARLVYNEGEDG